MSGAGERDKRERNGKSGLTPDKTKRPSGGGARTGPAPPLGPAGGGHDDAESAADRGADLAAAGGRARASIEQGPPEPRPEVLDAGIRSPRRLHFSASPPVGCQRGAHSGRGEPAGLLPQAPGLVPGGDRAADGSEPADPGRPVPVADGELHFPRLPAGGAQGLAASSQGDRPAAPAPVQCRHHDGRGGARAPLLRAGAFGVRVDEADRQALLSRGAAGGDGDGADADMGEAEGAAQPADAHGGHAVRAVDGARGDPSAEGRGPARVGAGPGDGGDLAAHDPLRHQGARGEGESLGCGLLAPDGQPQDGRAGRQRRGREGGAAAGQAQGREGAGGPAAETPLDQGDPVRGGGDHGGEGGGGRAAAQGPVERLPPFMGEVPAPGGRGGGRRGLDVGAGERADQDGRVQGVGGAAVSPAPPSGRGGRRPGSGRPPRSASTPPDRPGADSPVASSSASRRSGCKSGTRAASGSSPLLPAPDLARLEGELESARRDRDNARRQRQSERSLLAKAQELIAELEAENGALRRENHELSSVVGKYEQRELEREKAASRAGRARERKAAAEQMAIAAVEREAERLAEELEERDEQLAEAKAELEEAQGAAEAAAAEARAVKYQKMLSDRKLQRARDRLDNADTRAVRKCSAEEFAQLSRVAQRKENQRDRDLWREFLPEGRRLEPLIDVLDGQGRLGELFKLAKVQTLHLTGLAEFVTKIEQEHYGVSFGLFCHFELGLTMDKILRLTHAGSHKLDKTTGAFVRKIVYVDPVNKARVVRVPRVGAPRSKLEPVINLLKEQQQLKSAENGRVGFRKFDDVVAMVVKEDPGTHGMPPLPFFLGGKVDLPIILSLDATGFQGGQLTTAVLRNPYKPGSTAHLRLLAQGSVKDDRGGAEKLMGDNLPAIHRTAERDRQGRTQTILLDDSATADVRLALHQTLDTGALRHVDMKAGSGWCECDRHTALRVTPSRPESVEQMYSLLQACTGPEVDEEITLAHELHEGEAIPRPCTRCSFAHNPMTAAAERVAEIKLREALQADTSKAGRAKYAKWQLDRAKEHRMVKCGPSAVSLFRVARRRKHLCHLHVAKLNLPKTPWKWGLLNNCSDDARQQVQEKLAEFGHHLDLRRKDAGRDGSKKWFTGEAWGRLIAGDGKSPGGPVAIATFLVIMLDDLQDRGVNAGSETAAATPAPAAAAAKATKGKATKGKSARKAKTAAAAPAPAPPEPADAELTRQPSRVEREADAAHLELLREMYGSRAETAIRAALAFDAYFAWYYAWKRRVPINADKAVKEARALENMQLAVDLHEIYERVSLYNHGSYMPHGAIFKITESILEVGDVEAFDTGPLELLNAEAKRKAKSNGATNLETIGAGQAQRGPTKAGAQGPSRLCGVAERATTMALSVAYHLLITNALRRGDGVASIPTERRAERLFGDGPGRSKLVRRGIKLEHLGEDYSPEKDSVIAAMVRIVVARVRPAGDPEA